MILPGSRQLTTGHPEPPFSLVSSHWPVGPSQPMQHSVPGVQNVSPHFWPNLMNHGRGIQSILFL